MSLYHNITLICVWDKVPDECDFYYSENEIRMLKHDSIYKAAQF